MRCAIETKARELYRVCIWYHVHFVSLHLAHWNIFAAGGTGGAPTAGATAAIAPTAARRDDAAAAVAVVIDNTDDEDGDDIGATFSSMTAIASRTASVLA